MFKFSKHYLYSGVPADSPAYHDDGPPSYGDNDEFKIGGLEDKTVRRAFIRKVSEMHS